MPFIDVNELRRELSSVKEEMRGLCNAALESESKRMTDEQGTQYAALEGRKADLEGRIETAERSNALLRDGGESQAGENRGEGGSKFESFGEFLTAVRAAHSGQQIDPRLQESRAATGLNVGIPSDGGFLVQEDHLQEIQKRMYDTTLVADRCNRIPIGANSNRLTWNELDEKSRVDGSRWGGIQAYWAAEAATVTATQPKFARKSLELEKLMAFVYATDELLQDTTALEAMVGDLVRQELAYQLDGAIIEGSGAGVPQGILTSGATVKVPKESGQAAGSIVFENIVNMRARLWARSRANSVWYINQDCETELHKMALAVGTGGVPVYLPAQGLAGLPYDTLYGRPIIPIEHCKTVGTNGDIILADMSQYRLIDKGGVNQAVSMHVKFLTDEQVFRFTLRVNGMPLWSSALTPKNGSKTQSPFVTLATRA